MRDQEQQQQQQQQRRDSIVDMLANRLDKKMMMDEEETKRNAKNNVDTNDMKNADLVKDAVVEESQKRVAEETLLEKNHQRSEVQKREKESEAHVSQDQVKEEKKQVIEQQRQQQDQQRQQQRREKQQQQQQEQQQQRRQLRKRESKDVLANIDFPWSNKKKDDHREQQSAEKDFPFLSFLGKREIANDVSEYDELRDLDVRQIARALVAKRRAIESALLDSLDDRE